VSRQLAALRSADPQATRASSSAGSRRATLRGSGLEAESASVSPRVTPESLVRVGGRLTSAHPTTPGDSAYLWLVRGHRAGPGHRGPAWHPYLVHPYGL
jgi:hypothetical protein